MHNRNSRYNTDLLRLVAPEPERVQTLLGLFERDIFAIDNKSMEVFRGRQYLCSLRVSEAGIGTDAQPAATQARLRNGDIIYHVDLEPRILHLSSSLATKDSYHPIYNAEISLRINNPSTFLHHYFQGTQDVRLDPIARFQIAVERAFRRYAESIMHDKIKRRDLEAAAFKNHEGRNLGIWIERSVADIIEDPQRQKIREIEKQTEVAKALERSKAEVQRARSEYIHEEDARLREHNRNERSKDTNFEIEEDARKQLYAYHQKMREIIFNTVNAEWAEYILKELEKVDNSIPEFFHKNPQILQYYPGLSQLIALPQPLLTLNSPSSHGNIRNITDVKHGPLPRRQADGSF